MARRQSCETGLRVIDVVDGLVGKQHGLVVGSDKYCGKWPFTHALSTPLYNETCLNPALFLLGCWVWRSGWKDVDHIQVVASRVRQSMSTL